MRSSSDAALVDDGGDDKTQSHKRNRSEEFESSIVHPKLNLTMPSMPTVSSSSSSDASGDKDWTPTEGLGACFSTYARKCRELYSKSNSSSSNKEKSSSPLLLPFQNFCLSDDFVNHVTQCGVGFSKFVPNQHHSGKSKGNALHDQFQTILMTSPTTSSAHGGGSVGGDEASCIPDSACLSIVFHGTATANVNTILKNGLDPKRRRGQAYGPGEYFSKDPSVSQSYCKGGKSMLVFLVVVPPIAQQYRSLPSDYVVVKDNSHQLPLGVLHFDTVDPEALARANTMRHLT
ncbi:MAG: hypothetical protein SGARI_006300 [Bacillariaceae sp.]